MKMKLKKTTRNCPPKRRIPPAVASPTGKVVCMANPLAVDRRGYVNRPLKPVVMKVKSGRRNWKERTKKARAIIEPTPHHMQNFL